jgi:hypothetical protein
MEESISIDIKEKIVNVSDEKKDISCCQKKQPLSKRLCSTRRDRSTMIQHDGTTAETINSKKDQKVDWNEDVNDFTNTDIVYNGDKDDSTRSNIQLNDYTKYTNQFQRIINESIPNLLYTRQIYGSFGTNNNSSSGNSNATTRPLYYSNSFPIVAKSACQQQKYFGQKQQQSHLRSPHNDYAASRIAWYVPVYDIVQKLLWIFIQVNLVTVIYTFEDFILLCICPPMKL